MNYHIKEPKNSIDRLHNHLLSQGFRITGAPDEATVYTNAEGTVVSIEEPSQIEIRKELAKKPHPQNAYHTPAEIEIVLREQIILRDTKQQ